MELQVRNGAAVEVNDDVFGAAFNESLIHQVVTAFLAGGRAGTRGHKNRSAVSGGGAKPWRQKGTGRARAGTIRSPLWRGGGKTFVSGMQDHSQKLNKKMYRGAMRSIIAELIRQDRLVVTDLSFDKPSTKSAIAQLGELGVSKALILMTDFDENLALSVRNIPHIGLALASEVDPVSLVGADKVIASVDAVRQLEERLQ